MLTREGPRSFYKGTLPPMMGVGMLMSIMFTAQQKRRRQLALHRKPLGIYENALCGAFGGLCQAPVANTIELLKVRLQVQKNVANPLTMRQMFWQVWQSGGVVAFSRGLLPLTARDMIGYACYFGFCETMLAQLAPKGGTKKDVHPLKVMLVGMAGGLCYWVPVMPIDTIKNRLHADSLQCPKYTGTFDCLLKSVRSTGVLGLYRGLLLTCFMAFPKNATKLTVFELVQGMLQ